jgi:uncharacterized membrane protein
MKNEPEPSSHQTMIKYRVHWHVALVHFPISFFVASFLFQIIHLFPSEFTGCFEIATNVSLIFATVITIPAIITGWYTWKRSYEGARILIFQRKQVISYFMIGIALIMVVWRSLFFGVFVDIPFGVWHWLYLAGNALLIVGAVLEGFYGERLNHH